MLDAMTTTTQQTPPGPSVPEWTLADRLVKARKWAGLEQEELAEKADIARSSLSKYENGHAVPRRPVLISWALATGVSLAWLETGDETRPGIHGGSSSVQLAFKFRHLAAV